MSGLFVVRRLFSPRIVLLEHIKADRSFSFVRLPIFFSVFFRVWFVARTRAKYITDWFTSAILTSPKMQSCGSPQANVYKSGLFDSYYPYPVYEYPWVDGRSLSIGEWDLTYEQDAYRSYCPGFDYNLHGIVKTAVDMNSLKDAIYEAEAGTGEIEDIIMSCKFKPREAAFTKLIVTCGRWQDSQKALEVFHAMTEKRGVKPNTITYTALISACSSSGDCEAAMQVFRSMKRAATTDVGCQPNEVSCLTYLASIP